MRRRPPQSVKRGQAIWQADPDAQDAIMFFRVPRSARQQAHQRELLGPPARKTVAGPHTRRSSDASPPVPPEEALAFHDHHLGVNGLILRLQVPHAALRLTSYDLSDHCGAKDPPLTCFFLDPNRGT